MWIIAQAAKKGVYTYRMNKSSFVRVAAVVFTIVGLVHLYRALANLPINALGYDVPVIVSWVAGLVALFLGYTGYRHWR